MIIIYHFSEEAVFQHLEEFLRETDTVLQVQNKNHELELCLLLMQCFEVNAHSYRYVLIWFNPIIILSFKVDKSYWICFAGFSCRTGSQFKSRSWKRSYICEAIAIQCNRKLAKLFCYYWQATKCCNCEILLTDHCEISKRMFLAKIWIA